MIYYSTKNIYLCDLAYLGAEVSGLDEQKNRQTVTVSWVGHEPYRLVVKACPQGWQVIKGENIKLSELTDFMVMRFEPREMFPYLCFAKLRESKMRATLVIRVILFSLSLLWAYKFFTLGGLNYAIMSVLALLMSIVTFFLPREILKKTFADFQEDEERSDGPSALDIHDWFNPS